MYPIYLSETRTDDLYFQINPPAVLVLPANTWSIFDFLTPDSLPASDILIYSFTNVSSLVFCKTALLFDNVLGFLRFFLYFSEKQLLKMVMRS